MSRIAKLLYLFLAILSILTGCGKKVSLHQRVDNIDQIEFIYSPYFQFEVLYTLSDDEISECVDEIRKLNLRRSSSPSDNGGTYIVKITYTDGSFDSLGSWSVSYTSGDIIEHDGWYYISKNDLYNLFSRYIDPAQIPIP